MSVIVATVEGSPSTIRPSESLVTLICSETNFTVTKAVEEKKDQNGRQKIDRNTQEPLWMVQVMALDETGGEVLNVTLAGQTMPKITVGAVVVPVELEAIPLLLFGLGAALLVLVPFLGRAERGDRLRAAIGALVCVYVVAMTAWGYRSWVPVAVVLGSGVVLALLAWGTRQRVEDVS